MIENFISLRFKALQTNNGWEYVSTAFISFLQTHGIIHRLTCHYDHPQNGKVERKHRHITEIGLALLATASLPINFWDEAFISIVYLINKLPSSTTNFKSPHELIFHQKLDYSFFKVDGCTYHPNLRPYNSHKLEFCSQPYTFISYAP